MKNLLLSLDKRLERNREKTFPKIELALLLLSQSMYGAFAFQLIITFLAVHFSPGNEQFLTMIKNVEISSFEAIFSALVGREFLKKSNSYRVHLAALFFILFSASAFLLNLVPADLAFGPENAIRQSVVYAPLTLMSVSALCLLYNLIALVFKSVESPDTSTIGHS